MSLLRVQNIKISLSRKIDILRNVLYRKVSRKKVKYFEKYSFLNDFHTFVYRTTEEIDLYSTYFNLKSQS